MYFKDCFVFSDSNAYAYFHNLDSYCMSHQTPPPWFKYCNYILSSVHKIWSYFYLTDMKYNSRLDILGLKKLKQPCASIKCEDMKLTCMQFSISPCHFCTFRYAWSQQAAILISYDKNLTCWVKRNQLDATYFIIYSILIQCSTCFGR